MEKAGELMSFPCHGYVKKEDRDIEEDEEEHSAVKDETDESEDEMEVTNYMSVEGVPDFSCFSQAWGELEFVDF